MQGWRVSMEDAHFAVTGLNCGSSTGTQYSLFGVFDGHGGREVATFCKMHVPEQAAEQLRGLQQSTDHLGTESLAEAMVRTFNNLDEMLRSPEYEGELFSYKKHRLEDGEDGSEKSIPSAQVSQVQHRLQAAIANDMARARDRGTLSTQEAMRIAMGMSFLQRLDGNAVPGQSLISGTAAFNVGCTAVCVAITQTHVVCANAGDSRAVLSRAGRAVALSKDHKPNDRIERRRIEAAGGTVKEIHAGGANGGTGRIQYRVNGDLNLSRAVGDLRHKTRSDLRPDQQVVSSTPDIHIEAREPGDEFVVLACDGVWDVKTNAQVCDFVRQGIKAGRPLPAIIEELLDACLTPDPKQTQGLGADNMTCVVVKFESYEQGLGSPRLRAGGFCLPFRCLR